MPRLAGYLAFCWLAVAFYTLSGASSAAAFAVPAVGLMLTATGVLLRRVALRRLRSRARPS